MNGIKSGKSLTKSSSESGRISPGNSMIISIIIQKPIRMDLMDVSVGDTFLMIKDHFITIVLTQVLQLSHLMSYMFLLAREDTVNMTAIIAVPLILFIIIIAVIAIIRRRRLARDQQITVMQMQPLQLVPQLPTPVIVQQPMVVSPPEYTPPISYNEKY